MSHWDRAELTAVLREQSGAITMHTMDTRSAWSRVLCDPSLRDLPYKIETNEYGQLVMSPHKPRHSRLQLRVGELLDLLGPSGKAAVAFAVETSMGVKVPDAIWMSEEGWKQLPEDVEASPIAPEVCAEVISDSNTRAEIDEKRRLYFQHGALEVWTCDMKGRLRFFDPSGELAESRLFPSFPRQID